MARSQRHVLHRRCDKFDFDALTSRNTQIEWHTTDINYIKSNHIKFKIVFQGSHHGRNSGFHVIVRPSLLLFRRPAETTGDEQTYSVFLETGFSVRTAWWLSEKQRFSGNFVSLFLRSKKSSTDSTLCWAYELRGVLGSQPPSYIMKRNRYTCKQLQVDTTENY